MQIGAAAGDSKIDHSLGNRTGRLTDRLVFEAMGDSTCIHHRSEYIANSEVGGEIIWLPELLETLGDRQPTTTHHCDNQGAIAHAQKPSSHAMTQFVQFDITRYAMGRKADILTNSLPGPVHTACEGPPLGCHDVGNGMSARAGGSSPTIACCALPRERRGVQSLAVRSRAGKRSWGGETG